MMNERQRASRKGVQKKGNSSQTTRAGGLCVVDGMKQLDQMAMRLVCIESQPRKFAARTGINNEVRVLLRMAEKTKRGLHRSNRGCVNDQVKATRIKMARMKLVMKREVCSSSSASNLGWCCHYL